MGIQQLLILTVLSKIVDAIANSDSIASIDRHRQSMQLAEGLQQLPRTLTVSPCIWSRPNKHIPQNVILSITSFQLTCSNSMFLCK
jgi:hypothetical protein